MRIAILTLLVVTSYASVGEILSDLRLLDEQIERLELAMGIPQLVDDYGATDAELGFDERVNYLEGVKL